ncbi:phosphate/phosphite/phosphonate ABC transporter substrate-binding protein [Desulfurivibrio sp. C05AmB]|jgi:phosphonate transport system substrate-binding protein|uniref:phosphate/phosphite/phosphonate ABC transporter substrate-binding protein n=1 Tax=Desulfurivibrio sp. C05AmB TaxID=3374371 RepID=UPI00376EAFC6
MTWQQHRQKITRHPAPRWPALLCGLITICLLAAPPAGASDDETLNLWIHPYLPATELIRRFSPLADYLAEELERPVQIRVQQSYQTHIDLIGRDHADLAFIGPASYVIMRRQYGHKPLLAMLEENGYPVFQGMIIVREEAPFTSLTDLKGQSFAFGDPNSTMSYIVPRAMLAQAGVSLDDLARHDFLNSHHDVALAVLGGYFAAGGVKDEVFYAYQPRGLRALATSPLIPDHLFLTRADLPPALVDRLRELLLAINHHPRKLEILKGIKETVTGLVEAQPENYDSLEEMMAIFSGD